MATLTYVYSDQTAVLGPLANHAEPHSYDLCAEHAERLTAPRGWEVVRLTPDFVAVRAQPGRPARAGRRRPGGRPSPASAPPSPSPRSPRPDAAATCASCAERAADRRGPPPAPRSAAATLPLTFPTPAGAVAAARLGTRGATAPATRLPTQRPAGRPAAPVPPPAPLGSLVRADAPAVARASCPACGDGSVTRLAMTLADGSPVTFVSCHTCETRGWFAADGTPLGLDAVLGGAAHG